MNRMLWTGSPPSSPGFEIVSRNTTKPGTTTCTSVVTAVNVSCGAIMNASGASDRLSDRTTRLVHAAHVPDLAQPSPSHAFFTMYGIAGGRLLTGPQSR